MICFSLSLCLYPLPSPLACQFQMTHTCQIQTHFRVVIPDAFSAQKVSLSPRCSQGLCPLCLSPLKCHLKPFLTLAQIKLPAYIHAFLVHPFRLLHFLHSTCQHLTYIYLIIHLLSVSPTPKSTLLKQGTFLSSPVYPIAWKIVGIHRQTNEGINKRTQNEIAKIYNVLGRRE